MTAPVFVSIPEAARLMGIGRTLAYDMATHAQAGVGPELFSGSFA